MHYSKYFHRDSFFFDMWNFGELFAKKNKLQDDALDASTKIGSLSLSNSSLRKQPTFRDATPGFPLKWRLRNELTNSILMTRHYLHPFGWQLASTNQQHYSHLRSDASSIWKFCSRFSDVISWGKKVVASRNFSCFLRLFKLLTKQRSIFEQTKYSYRQNAKPRKWNTTHRFSLHVTYQVLFSAICVCMLHLNSTRGRSRKIVSVLLIFKLPAEKHVLFGKFKWHAHGWADDAITRQNLIKIRNKPHAYHVTISFSFSPCLHIVKVPIASIQGNFLSHAFTLFVFAKKCSFLIGSHTISFPYLLNYVHSLTTKGKRFCREKSWK